MGTQRIIKTATNPPSLCASRWEAAREWACTAFQASPIARAALRACDPNSKAAGQGSSARAGSARFCNRGNSQGDCIAPAPQRRGAADRAGGSIACASFEMETANPACSPSVAFFFLRSPHPEEAAISAFTRVFNALWPSLEGCPQRIIGRFFFPRPIGEREPTPDLIGGRRVRGD
jgi:hypothetical protein